MTVGKKKVAIWVVVLAILAGSSTAILIIIHKRHRISLKGTVIRQDQDPSKQAPIADVEITAITGFTVSKTKSDPSGFFSLLLPRGFRRRQSVTLQFLHADYQPLDISELLGDKLYVVHLQPTANTPLPQSDRARVVVSNVRARYSIKTMTEPDVGSVARTFQVVNTGNLPCQGRHPCSPDGKWKAALGSTSIDAGEGNEFRHVRVSCIAGPCPFTRIELEDLSRGGRSMNVTARVWSDTATFLLEAEVVHPMVSDIVRESYPVIFGQTLSFSLPVTAEGPSIEAEINGEAIVFPLGPDLFLNWAQCSLGTSRDQSKVYQCELKSGYRFR